MDYDQRTYLRVVMLPDGGGARVVSSQARNGSVQAPQFALVETRSAGNLLVFHFVSIQLLRITVSARLADVAALRSCQQEKQTKAAESSYPVAWWIRLESPLSPPPPRAMERRQKKTTDKVQTDRWIAFRGQKQLTQMLLPSDIHHGFMAVRQQYLHHLLQPAAKHLFGSHLSTIHPDVALAEDNQRPPLDSALADDRASWQR